MWKGKGDQLKIDVHKLNVDELQTYAITATEIRRKFKAKVDAIEEGKKGSDALAAEESK